MIFISAGYFVAVVFVNFVTAAEIHHAGHSVSVSIRKRHAEGTKFKMMKTIQSHRSEDRSEQRRKRYVLNPQRFKFHKRHIHYRIENRPKCCMSRDDVRENVRRAFNTWSSYCGLHFVDVTYSYSVEHSADIIITFVSGIHGDSEPFDGPNGLLAHSPLPIDDKSFIHFDDDEHWYPVKNPFDYHAKDFYYTALHEVGHVIGLEHAEPMRGNNPVMVADYSAYSTVPVRLTCDDVLAANALYGYINYPSYCKLNKRKHDAGVSHGVINFADLT